MTHEWRTEAMEEIARLEAEVERLRALVQTKQESEAVLVTERKRLKAKVERLRLLLEAEKEVSRKWAKVAQDRYAELERLREKLAHAEAENMGLREELTTELERLREENERLQKQWDESFAGKTGRLRKEHNARIVNGHDGSCIAFKAETYRELERLRGENERLQKQWDESFAGKTGRMSIAMEDDNARLQEAARESHTVIDGMLTEAWPIERLAARLNRLREILRVALGEEA